MSMIKVGHRTRRRGPAQNGQETCMPDSPEGDAGRLVRPVYWKRQAVSADDLTAGQDYLRHLLREHNRLNHGAGVVCGLEVLPADNAASGYPRVMVTHGYAVSPQGDEIYVPDNQMVVIDCVPLAGDECLDPTITPIAQEVHLVIGYGETPACPVLHLVAPCDPSPICEHRRVEAGFDIQCQTMPSPFSLDCQAWIDELMRCGPPSSLGEIPLSFFCPSDADPPWVVLARLHLDKDGQVAEIDYGVRQRNFSIQLLGSLVRCMASLAPITGDEGPRFEIDRDHRGEFSWRLLARSGEIMVASRRFLTRAEAESELERIRRLAFILPADDPTAFSRAEHPVESVLGIGPIYRCRLDSIGITTVGHLAIAQPATVAAALGVSSRRGAAFVEAANRLLSDDG